jgi:hypothetical protein
MVHVFAAMNHGSVSLRLLRVDMKANAINSGNREKKDGVTSEATGTRPMEDFTRL